MGHEVIDAVRAAKLISGYSREIKTNITLLSKEIGGIFHAQDFRKWFENEREVFVEFVCQRNVLDSNRIFVQAMRTGHDELIAPLNTFESPELSSEIDLLSFIHRQRKSDGNLFVNGDWNDLRIAHAQALSALSVGKPSKFEITFSKRENPFDILLHVRKTEVLYIRYFFGINESHGKQLSLILAPVDIAGRNILVLPDGTAASWIELR